MRISIIILTAIYSILSALGVMYIFSGYGSIFSLVIIAGYIFTAIALNGKGGQPFRIVSFVAAGLLSLFLIGGLVGIFAPLIGYAFEPMLISTSFILAGLGVWTIYCLRFINKSSAHNQAQKEEAGDYSAS
jgi:hypothetical protein